MLIAQGFAQIAHRLLAGAALAALAGLALRHLHVFHELAQHFHHFGSFRHAAFVDHLLQFVQHLLQLVLRHLNAGLIFGCLLIGVALRLFGQLFHIVVQSLTHLVHQLLNFIGISPVADGLIQPVLRAAQALQC